MEVPRVSRGMCLLFEFLFSFGIYISRVCLCCEYLHLLLLPLLPLTLFSSYFSSFFPTPPPPPPPTPSSLSSSSSSSSPSSPSSIAISSVFVFLRGFVPVISRHSGGGLTRRNLAFFPKPFLYFPAATPPPSPFPRRTACLALGETRLPSLLRLRKVFLFSCFSRSHGVSSALPSSWRCSLWRS